MRHRLIVLVVAAGIALAATTQTVVSAWSTKAQPGASRFAAATLFPPRLLTAPAISGTRTEDQTLTATAGSWTRGTVTTTIEWLRCDSGSCTKIDSGQTHVLTAGDVGKQLKVKVTAANAAGSSAAESALSGVVAAAPPQNTTPPAISGTTTGDELLTGDPGTWSHPDAHPAYRWLRCTTTCTAIPNETGATLLLTGADAGATIKFEVTHKNVTATSPATGTITRPTYVHVMCSNPVNGEGVGSDGVLPDGWSHTDTFAAINSNPAANTRCSQTNSGGIPLTTGGTFTTTTPDDRTSLLYRTPANIDFHAAEIYRRGQMSGRWSWAVQRSSGTSLFSLRFELCSWSDGCFARGASTPRYGPDNKVAVRFSATNGFNITISCDIGSGSQCNADNSQVVWFYGGTATLRDTASPRLTTAATGSLTTDTTLNGMEQLDFGAADDGAGLYRIRVRLDDSEVLARVLTENGGKCVDADSGNQDPFEFARQRPCPASAAAAQQFDTSSWPRGTHRLRVLLEDAGRNTTTIVDRTVTLP